MMGRKTTLMQRQAACITTAHRHDAKEKALETRASNPEDKQVVITTVQNYVIPNVSSQLGRMNFHCSDKAALAM